MLFSRTLAMVAEFEANLGHLRTREGMAKARRQGKLRGKQPKLPASAARTIRRRYAEGQVSLADLAEEYRVGRSTIHRIIHRPVASLWSWWSHSLARSFFYSSPVFLLPPLDPLTSSLRRQAHST